jgi:hypothetical protein
MEVTRIGEEAVLPCFRKSGAGRKTCGFESHGLRSMKQTQSCGLAAKAPVLQTGDRRFESVQDYSVTTRPIGPVWSGRHPVTVEITGSNPVWVADSGT